MTSFNYKHPETANLSWWHKILTMAPILQW